MAFFAQWKLNFFFAFHYPSIPFSTHYRNAFRQLFLDLRLKRPGAIDAAPATPQFPHIQIAWTGATAQQVAATQNS